MRLLFGVVFGLPNGAIGCRTGQRRSSVCYPPEAQAADPAFRIYAESSEASKRPNGILRPARNLVFIRTEFRRRSCSSWKPGRRPRPPVSLGPALPSPVVLSMPLPSFPLHTHFHPGTLPLPLSSPLPLLLQLAALRFSTLTPRHRRDTGPFTRQALG